MLWKGLLLLILLVPFTANAAFWDDAINKVKKATEETVNKSIDSITDSEDNQNSPTNLTSNDQTHTAVSNQFDSSKELGRLTFLATIHYHPEVLDDDEWLKRAANTLYPEEAEAFYNNEFAWQKSKGDIKARTLKEAENALLTFQVSPWTNPNGGRLLVGDYDFNRKAFKIRGSQIKPPSGVGDMRPYLGELHKIIVSDIAWLPVSPEIAEKLVQSSTFSNTRALYGEFAYTITGAKKYESKGKIKLISNIKLNKVKLYHRISSYAVNGAKDYEYVTTLVLPEITAQKSDPTPAKKKKTVKQTKETPASALEPKSSPVENVKQVEPQPKDPLADLGPYARVKKGAPYGPDIVGLQLGMTLQDVNTLVRKHKETNDMVSGKAPKPFVTAKAYVLKPGDESISVFTLDSPAGERVAGYVRYVYFDPAKAPTQVAMASSLEKKYGKPTYVYDVKGNFERRWLTNALSEPVEGDKYGNSKGVGKCEGAARSSSGAKVFSGQKQGYPFLWSLPWQQGGSPAGSIWHMSPGDVKIDQVNRCGSVLVARYGDGSGSVTGPTLSLSLFDSAWITEEVNKQKAAERAQGAKGLNL